MSRASQRKLAELLDATRIKEGGIKKKSGGSLISKQTDSSSTETPKKEIAHPNIVKTNIRKTFDDKKEILTREVSGEGGFKSRSEFWGGWDTRWQQSREIVAARDTGPPESRTKNILGGQLITRLDVENKPTDQLTGKTIEGRFETDHPVPQWAMKRKTTHPVGENKWPQWVIDKHGPSITRSQARDIKNERRVLQTTAPESNQLKGAKTIMDYHPEYGYGTKDKPLNWKPKQQAQRYHDALLYAAQQTNKHMLTREEGWKIFEMTGEWPTVPGRIDKFGRQKGWEDPEMSPPLNNPPTVGKDAPKKVIQKTTPSPKPGKDLNVKPARRPTNKYDYSPQGQWRKLKGSKDWEKTPSADIKVKAVTKKKADTKANKKSKVSRLQKMFPGINAPKLVKDKQGNLLSPAVIKAKNKRKNKIKKDEEDIW